MSMQPPYPPQQPPYPPPPIRPLSPQEERTWGMLCHLLALSAFVTGIGMILGPLIVWLIKKDASPFVNEQGKNSLNFQISCLIYSIVLAILCFVLSCFICIVSIALAAPCFVLIWIPLLIALAVFWLVEVIIASVAASEGRSHIYPLTMRFIS